MSTKKGQAALNDLLNAGMDDIEVPSNELSEKKAPDSVVTKPEPLVKKEIEAIKQAPEVKEQTPTITVVAQTETKSEQSKAKESNSSEDENAVIIAPEKGNYKEFIETYFKKCEKGQAKIAVSMMSNHHAFLKGLAQSQNVSLEDLFHNIITDFKARNQKHVEKSIRQHATKMMDSL